MAKAFREYLPEKTEYAVPQGGFFFWLRLPGIDTKELFYKAVDRGVAFVIGESFFPVGAETSLPELASPSRAKPSAKRGRNDWPRHRRPGKVTCHPRGKPCDTKNLRRRKGGTVIPTGATSLSFSPPDI
jgi:hypothetical protein